MMSIAPDFDFGFGKGRYLRGRGWRGLIALALVLGVLAICAEVGVTPLVQGGVNVARLLQ
jgi:hypothetical protein